MSKSFQRGLVVGKFCPLHLGHESVIQRAIEMCDDVVAISYTNPEYPGCEPAKRRAWLAARFPQVRSLVLDGSDSDVPPNGADELTHRRFVCELCRDRLGVSIDAVFTSEDYGEGFARDLTVCFREREPRHPVVTHVAVDIVRARWPVSGTMLRHDIHRYSRFVTPEVYASFVERVALLGGESSGKSTLAAALATELGTEWVPEFGRELWEARGGQLTLDDMPLIARTQIAREEEAFRRAHRYVFCDSTPLTTMFYSDAMFGRVPPELRRAAQRAYGQTVLCVRDFPFVQDGTRRGPAFATRQQDWYTKELARRGIEYLCATGPMRNRVDTVMGHLALRRS